MNPFISFCVYVAARVFVQYLKTRPKDQQMNSSLQFLLQAMQALRRKNPLTESFLVQLDLDLESAGVAAPQKISFPSVPNAAVSDHLQHLAFEKNDQAYVFFLMFKSLIVSTRLPLYLSILTPFHAVQCSSFGRHRLPLQQSTSLQMEYQRPKIPSRSTIHL